MSSPGVWLADEAKRRAAFPCLDHGIFLGHAGVAVLPRVAADALTEFGKIGSERYQENDSSWHRVNQARATAARLMGARASEVALLGPTALGLSLVALGLPWEAGDEVIYFPDDYPANVYPWLALREKGVRLVPVVPEKAGRITWELVRAAITPRTKLVALASCHFLTGFRLDLPTVGGELRKRGILFSLDGIQTLGAFPTLAEHADFISADSHKWLLGPVGAGIFYVAERNFERLKPALLGSWNVQSPDFIAQREIAFYDGARRYEPGTLNLPGIFAMQASMELLLETGSAWIEKKLLELHHYGRGVMRSLGFEPVLEDEVEDLHRSGIVTFRVPPSMDVTGLSAQLVAQGVVVSWRKNRDGEVFLRISPHFYNTCEDLDRFTEILAGLIRK